MVVVEGAIDAAEERCVFVRADVRVGSWSVVSVVVSGWAMPVRAVQISAIGGFASLQGTVKRGLSHLLCVLGSSYRKMRFWRRAGG